MSQYRQLLLKWGSAINLSSVHDSNAVGFQAHIDDSLSLIEHLPPSIDRVIDLGSGQGFPAIPIAIMTGVAIAMVEADRRKAAFLETAIAKLGLPGAVYRSRIKTVRLSPTQCLTARALAPLTVLLKFATQFLLPGGTALFLKGTKAADEVAHSSIPPGFSYEILPTPTRSNLVKVRRLE